MNNQEKKYIVENSKNESLDRRIKLCQEKAEIGDSVAVYKKDGVLKRGIIVKLTSAGAHVFNPDSRKDGDFDGAGADGAEWFSFKNKVDGKLGGMVLI